MLSTEKESYMELMNFILDNEELRTFIDVDRLVREGYTEQELHVLINEWLNQSEKHRDTDEYI